MPAPPLNLVNAGPPDRPPRRVLGPARARCARSIGEGAAAAAGARAGDAPHRCVELLTEEKAAPCPALKRPDDARRASSCRRARRCSPARPTCWWSAAARPASARRSARPRPARAWSSPSATASSAATPPRRWSCRSCRSTPRRRPAGAPRRHHAAADRPRPGRAGGRRRAARSCSSGWCSAGGAIPPSLATGYVVPFDPEWFKLVALDLLDEAGVQFLFHAFASGVLGESTVEGVVFETKSGPGRDPREGDDRLHRRRRPRGAGRRAVRGRPRRRPGAADDADVPHGASSSAPRSRPTCKQNPKQWRGVHGLWDLVREATQAGELKLPREDILFFATPHEGEVSVNSTRVTRVLGTDVWDLSYAEWMSRQPDAPDRRVPARSTCRASRSPTWCRAASTSACARRGASSATTSSPPTTCSSARKFDDAIARGAYPVDIHNPTGTGTVLKRLPPGEAYDIPLRCLLPQNAEGLLVAGPLHLRHARGAFVLPRDADRDGDRPGRRRRRRARRAPRRCAARDAAARDAARAGAPGRQPAQGISPP